MPARLVLNPVVVVDGVRKPKCATIADPGRPAVRERDENGNPVVINPTYVHSSVISSGQPGERNDICLSLVAGVDLSALDTDPEIVTLLEERDRTVDDLKAVLQATPRDRAWSALDRARVSDRMRIAGADIIGLDDQSPLYAWANRMAQAIQPGTDVRQLRTTTRGD